MKTPILVLLFCALLAFASAAFGAGYAVHGSYYENGASSHPVPAVLYISVKEGVTKVRLVAPKARCVPEFKDSTYVEGSRTRREIDLPLGSLCGSEAAAAHLHLELGVGLGRGVLRAELTDLWNEKSGQLLFRAN